jgi:hypothetical protein
VGTLDSAGMGGACRSLMGRLAALHRPALREALLPRGRMAKPEQQAIVGCPGLTPLDPEALPGMGRLSGDDDSQ